MQNMSANMSKNNANQQEARNCPIVGFKQSEADCSMTDPRKQIIYSNNIMSRRNCNWCSCKIRDWQLVDHLMLFLMK